MTTRPVVIVRAHERGKPAARPPATPAPLASPAPSASERRPHTFLVVDDSAVHLNLLARQLQSGLGCHVVQADGVETAIAYLLTARPDVMMVDLMMPELSGMDLFAALQAARPEQARRIIFVTAGGFTPKARAFLAEAHAPCIEKPVSIPALLAAIDAVAPG